jgi:hypothetical protein
VLLPRFNQFTERAADERNIARILIESSVAEIPKTVARATLPGDNRRLRGIPCIARGVQGCSPGTDPAWAVVR